MKYIVFSLDDGTVFDRATIELFSRYDVHATFNLNSGLSSFVWYYEDKIPIYRNDLERNVHLYDNHEVASHTLTHPYLDSCPDERVIEEVRQDKANLERIFHREIVSFATPFETAGEREVELIKNNTGIKNIRLSYIDESFQIPVDPYHIPITAMDISRALELLPSFLELEEGCFIYAGHSYDFYIGNSFDQLEEFLRSVSNRSDVRILTMGEFAQDVICKNSKKSIF